MLLAVHYFFLEVRSTSTIPYADMQVLLPGTSAARRATCATTCPFPQTSRRWQSSRSAIWARLVMNVLVRQPSRPLRTLLLLVLPLRTQRTRRMRCVCWSRARRVKGRDESDQRREEQSREECRAESRPEEQSTEKSSAERRAERRAEAQRRKAETRRKGAEAQSLKPAEFRAEREKTKR